MSTRKKMTIVALATTAVIITGTAIAGGAFAANDGEDKSRWGWGKRHHSESHYGGHKRGHMRGKMMRGAMIERLKQADADGDGKVTKAEITARQEGDMAKFDTDKDGQLSLSEYKSLWMEKNNQRAVRSFQRLDRDGDGNVTDAEMKRFVDRIVSRMDRNEDGAISKEDFKRKHRRN